MTTFPDENFERIWLEPSEGADPYTGRQWCQDNQWGGDGIEYVRADIADKRSEPDPPGYQAMMELMHRGANEIRDAGGMSARANALYELIWALEKEFPEARALIDQRWGK